MAVIVSSIVGSMANLVMSIMADFISTFAGFVSMLVSPSLVVNGQMEMMAYTIHSRMII